MTANETEQVQVRFKTRSARYAVIDAPIMVPVTLRRFGLSEVVNHLLGNHDNPVPFDFIIDGTFLRTTVGSYLESHNLSTENILEVEYVASSVPPREMSSLPHDDWISDIAVTSGGWIATSSFDGKSRLWTSSGNCEVVLSGHERGVKSIAWLTENAPQFVATGGEDERIIVWSFDTNTRKAKEAFECIGHGGSVDSLSVSTSGTRFASASADSSIKIWGSELPEVTESIDVRDSSSGKRRKIAPSSIPVKKPLVTLDGHGGAVSSVCFSKSSGIETRLYSGGWDHSVRIWDVEANSNISSMTCEKVVLDVQHSEHSGLLASGHADSYIRLWDPRDQNGLAVKLKLGSHTQWVPSVAWSPTDAFKLGSGSYDGSLKVWDIRSRTPLHTIKVLRNPDTETTRKILRIVWSENLLFSGGEDKNVHIHKT